MKVINVKVKPNASKTRIISEQDDLLVIAIAAPAEENKANLELIKLLAKHFKSHVEIIRGLASKNKVVRVQ